VCGSTRLGRSKLLEQWASLHGRLAGAVQRKFQRLTIDRLGSRTRISSIRAPPKWMGGTSSSPSSADQDARVGQLHRRIRSVTASHMADPRFTGFSIEVATSYCPGTKHGTPSDGSAIGRPRALGAI
jgi:hypothetical protein